MAYKNNRVKSTNDLELKDRLVAINRVTKVTKGGRTFTFAAIVVVGNEDGIVGWGLGKANEVTAAIAKGVEAAKKNLIRVPVHKGTIPHEQEAKFGGSRVILRIHEHIKRDRLQHAGGRQHTHVPPVQTVQSNVLPLIRHHVEPQAP